MGKVKRRPDPGGERVSRATEMRLRNIFIGSIALSALIVFNLVHILIGGGGVWTIVSVSFPAMLLWSLGVSLYAFVTLWRAARRQQKIVEEMTDTDRNTGARSLDYVRKILQQEYETALKTGETTSILYVDLDKIDVVNRQFGHTVGNVVLKGVAELMQGHLPQEGTLGRVAGDEFVAVLPATTKKQAESVADAIKRGIESYRLDLAQRGQVDFLDCRIGVIAISKEAPFVDEVISAAHHAARECGI